MRRWWYVPVVGVIIAGFIGMYYSSLGSYALRDWDESIYAQVAKQSSDAFGFTWLGNGLMVPDSLWFEKPPLIIWLVKLSFIVFGQNELAARIYSPILGAGILLICFLWAKRIAGSVWAGLLATAVFGVCFHFLLSVGALNLDIPVACFALLAMYSFASINRSGKYWYLFWISIALGVLTKSVVGLFPVAVVLLYILIYKEWGVLRHKAFLKGLLLGLLLVVPWHLVETVRYGTAFWSSYFGHHILNRFVSGIENNGLPWWWYSIIFTQFPYALFAGAGLCYALYQSLRKEKQYALLLLSFIGLFLIFSVAKTKGSGYIVLVYPYLSILAGAMLYALVSYLRFAWLRVATSMVLIGTFMYLGIQFNSYRLVRMKSPVYEDVKEIGVWVKDYYADKPLQYIEFASPDFLVSSRPLLVYYSGRYVGGFSTLPPGVAQLDPVYRTRTHQVYIDGDAVYVVAVRYVP